MPVEETASPVDLSARDFYAQAEKSVVVVQNIEAGSMGSGVEIFEGVFVTNCHVLQDGTTFVLLRNGGKIPARLIRQDVSRDTCLLYGRDAETHPVDTRSAKTLKVGEEVYALGNPQGLELTLSTGIVSQLREGFGDAPLIQTNASISRGSSGGGIFDKTGKLVGISTFMLREGQNLNFAVPIDWALELYANKESIAHTLPSPELEPEAETQPEEQIDPRTLNEQAIAFIRAGSPERAVPVLISAAERSPQDPEILGNLGYALMLSDQHTHAKQVLLAALKASPKRAATWLNLGQVYAELGDAELAVRTLRNGYRLSSRKEAVRSALQAVANDAEASQHWKEAASATLVSLQNSASPTNAEAE
jgi:hypothetical protein